MRFYACPREKYPIAIGHNEGTNTSSTIPKSPFIPKAIKTSFEMPYFNLLNRQYHPTKHTDVQLPDVFLSRC